jgi:NADH-quinone oxidoreductase subunit J
MISPHAAILGLGTALAAVGIWWLLPGSSLRRRTLGGVLALVGFGCLGAQVPVVGDWFTKGMFHAIAAATIVAAVATISFRSPVYCAIWFGMTLTGTAGLFLLAGAEFLAVATIVVYAGAILVTFLFVLMLSQPEGHTSYDRRSWEAMISAFTGAVLVGILTAMIGSVITKAASEAEFRMFRETESSLTGRHILKTKAAEGSKAGATSVAERSASAAAGHNPYTISRLGAVLFTRYLVAVEAAGALLFAALVGAAVIVGQGRAAGLPENPRAGGGTRQPAGGEGGTVHAS